MTNAALTPDAWEGANGGKMNPFYVRDTATGSYRLLTPAALSGATPYGATNFVGGSADFGQLLIETTAELTPDAVALTDSQFKLYKWDDGVLSLQTVLPDGTPTSGSAAGGATQFLSATVNERTTGTISRDGSTVYFTAPASTFSGRLYRREDDETVLVNAEENDSEVVAEGAAFYRLGSADGSKVLFASQQHLVEEDTNATTAAGRDLYMYTHSDDPLVDANLTLVSAAETPGTATGEQGVLAMADDGSRVYFVATGRLTADAPADTVRKAYLWESGDVTSSGNAELRYIGSVPNLPGGTLASAFTQAAGAAAALRSVSAGGEALMLLTSDQLDPDRDNGGTLQVYRYGASEDDWACISCPADHVPTAAARIRYLETAFTLRQRGTEPTYLSHDGSRAMFESVEPLVEEDVNGRRDVYLWEDGEVHLISSGRSDFQSFAVEIPGTGDSVFFTTTERLVARDTDDSRDVYVAKVGGGQVDPPRSPAPCAGDACQGPSSSSPPALAPASQTVVGARNLIQGEFKRLSLRRPSLRQRRKAARSGIVRLRVRSNRAGVVKAFARGRIGKRVRRLGAASKRLPRPGSTTVRLDLNAVARKRLRAGRKLSVTLQVRSSGATPRSIRIALRRAGK